MRCYQWCMETIVDGYNLIFSCGWEGKTTGSMALEKARHRLIVELSALVPPDSRSQIKIIFDAKTTPIKATTRRVTQNGFEILFADQFDEADSLIEDLIRHHSAPKSLTVVSDDHRLQTAAKRKKAKPIGCEDWLAALERGDSATNQRTGSVRPRSGGPKSLQRCSCL